MPNLPLTYLSSHRLLLSQSIALGMGKYTKYVKATSKAMLGYKTPSFFVGYAHSSARERPSLHRPLFFSARSFHTYKLLLQTFAHTYEYTLHIYITLAHSYTYTTYTHVLVRMNADDIYDLCAYTHMCLV